MPRDGSAPETSEVVAVDGLSKRFGAVTAVEDFSFTVQRGDPGQGMLILWIALKLGLDAYFYATSRRRLTNDFRALVTGRFDGSKTKKISPPSGGLRVAIVENRPVSFVAAATFWARANANAEI